MIFIRDGN